MVDTAAERLSSQAGRAAARAPVVYGALFLQVLIGAGTFLVAKRTLSEIHAFPLLAARFLLSGLLFCLILFWLPGPAVPPRHTWGRVLYLGFLAGPINQGFLFWGLERSTPIHAALFYALTPLGVYLYALLRRQERPSRRRVLGIAVALAGVVILLLGRGLRAALGPLVGDVFILAAVAAWAVYTAEGTIFSREHGAIRATCWTLIAATLWTLPSAPFVLSTSELLAASGLALAGLVYLAVFSSVASYVLWYFALSRLGASRVAVFANLQPVVTALAARWLLGEALNWEMALGGALVLIGVFITQSA